MTTNLFRACLLVVSFGAVTTSVAQRSTRAPSLSEQLRQRDTPSNDPEKCPDFIRGSKLAVREVDRGVQLTVTTTDRDSVPPIRALTHNVAGYVEENERAGSNVSGEHDADSSALLPPLDLTVTDISDGARISVQAQNRADVPVLREKARRLAEAWRTDVCVNGQKEHA